MPQPEQLTPNDKVSSPHDVYSVPSPHHTPHDSFELSQTSVYSIESDLASQVSNTPSNAASDLDLCSIAEFVPDSSSQHKTPRISIRRRIPGFAKVRLSSIWSSAPRALSDDYLANIFGTQLENIDSLSSRFFSFYGNRDFLSATHPTHLFLLTPS